MSMAPRKYTGYRKKTYRKRGAHVSAFSRIGRFASSGVRALTMAHTAYKTAMALKSVLNPEQKYFDVYTTSYPSVPSNLASLLIPLSDMGQGTTAQTRTGISIKAASNLHNCTLFWDSAGGGPQRVRFMLIIDTNQDGVAPAVQDVVDSSGGGTDVSNMPLNAKNVGRFTILCDKIYLLDQYHPTVEIERFDKMNHHVKFADGGTGASSLRDGNIFAFYWTDTSVNGPTFSYYNRFRYYDN